MAFARLPMIRWMYTRIYFRDVDMAVFDHVFDHATLREDWYRVVRAIGVDAAPVSVNRTSDLNPQYIEGAREVMASARKMAALRDVFADDIRFYERHAGCLRNEDRRFDYAASA
jgi:hypothetical protein